MRLLSGSVTLRVDDAWRRELDPRARRLVTRITWPLLRRYGYLPDEEVGVMAATAAGASADTDTSALPNLIIAGVGKAGTTSLFWYLAQHPDVCASDVKEIQYFTPLSEGDGILPPLAEYAAHFRGLGGRALPPGGEPAVLPRRAAHRRRDAGHPAERPRVIVMFRDPVDRLWSQFRFMRSRLADLPDGMTFEGYVEACREVRERREPFSQENRLYWTIQGGFYGEYLDPWTEAFGDDLRVVFFEDLAASPERVTLDDLLVARAGRARGGRRSPTPSRTARSDTGASCFNGSRWR